jgi:RNase P subunit RPR2
MPGTSINCNTSRIRLASIDNDALYLWCKRCNTQHAYSKEQVLQMWGIQLPKQETVVKA